MNMINYLIPKSKTSKSLKSSPSPPPPPPSPSPSPTTTSSSPASSLINPSSNNYPSTNDSPTCSEASKSLSFSSKTSLSSLKDSLPENPHIYDFSEICKTTSNFLKKPFSSSSSSTSWRCSIRGKEVIIFQRKFRRQIGLPELQKKLLTICRSHHSSVIKLLGVSSPGNYIYLVYDRKDQSSNDKEVHGGSVWAEPFLVAQTHVCAPILRLVIQEEKQSCELGQHSFMAAARNTLQLRRLLSALAHNNQPFTSSLNKEHSWKLLPSASSLFTRNDFYGRGLQTLAKPANQANEESENHENGLKPNCSSANAPAQANSNEGSATTCSSLSSLKTSPRHDLAMIFTCKVCETRSVKTVCRESYEKGVVVARCGGCNNLHLISDHLGWFGQPGSIEEILAARGEEVKKGSADTFNLTLEDLAGKKIFKE